MEHLTADPTPPRVLQLVPHLRDPQTVSTPPFSDLTTGPEGGHPVLSRTFLCASSSEATDWLNAPGSP